MKWQIDEFVGPTGQKIYVYYLVYDDGMRPTPNYPLFTTPFEPQYPWLRGWIMAHTDELAKLWQDNDDKTN